MNRDRPCQGPRKIAERVRLEEMCNRLQPPDLGGETECAHADDRQRGIAPPVRMRDRDRAIGGGEQQDVDGRAARISLQQDGLVSQLEHRLLGQQAQVGFRLGDQDACHRGCGSRRFAEPRDTQCVNL